MRVLMANTFHYLRGGDCTYALGLTELLKANGNEVVSFAMEHPNNLDSAYSKYFVSNIDFINELRDSSVANGVKVMTRAIFSKEARRNVEELIADTKPDIVHIQNIHGHITPSILKPIKQLGLPIIWTLHDYKLICPNTNFLCNGMICERCKKSKYFYAPLMKCKKDSRAASLVSAMEAYTHRLLGIRGLVDKFIAPSLFLRNKLIEYDFKESQVIHIPNFIDVEQYRMSESTNDYFIFAGRLTKEKGVDVLLRAINGLKNAHLLIAGDGPQRLELESIARLDKHNRIEFLGYLSQEKLKSLLEKAKFIVVPSTWYENYPYSILEAFAYGKPVIGSRIGGIPELVKDGISGYLFEAFDEKGLRRKIEQMVGDPSSAKEMGRKAREQVETICDPGAHYTRIINTYKEVLEMQ